MKNAYSADAFKSLIGDKTIYIYAVNLEGLGFSRRFARMGLKVGGFIDSRSFKDNVKFGLPVQHPDEFFAREDKNVFVLITTKHQMTRKYAIDCCQAFGLEKNQGFMTFTTLCDYLPTIETAGLCNLRCRTCNMGLPGANKHGGLMSADTFRQVMHKLSEEIPFINSVYLYLWGEPLINPDLPEMLHITREYGVATEISTNLINILRLDDVMKARPDVIVAPCAGTGERFARGRTGGTWDVYRDNLYHLRESVNKYNPEATVRITYHCYRDNMQEDYDEVQEICAELGFLFQPILAQLFPERVLNNVLNGDPIPQMMIDASKDLCYSIEDQLSHARASKDKFCPAIKAFPTIRWDTSVAHCSNLMEPVLSKSYLDMSFSDLLATRDGNGFCGRCMKEGMHRFFDVQAQITETEDGRRAMIRR